jgi:hypothetical protein
MIQAKMNSEVGKKSFKLDYILNCLESFLAYGLALTHS